MASDDAAPTPGEGNGEDPLEAARRQLVEAALPHVAFDGWSRESLNLALAETGIERDLADLAFPRGGVDMALAFHRLKDAELARDLAARQMEALRMRDRIAYAVRRRIELVAEHKEAVRRGATLLGLPMYATEGATAIWETADIIWEACGDTAEDYNWYTKRAILAGVYSATVLFWLGDESRGFERTWAFLDRRIEGVMQFEKIKGTAEKNPILRQAFAGPMALLSMVRAPSRARRG